MPNILRFTSKLFVVAGNASSGKDNIISATRELGAFHAQIVTKYTSRAATKEDGSELVCAKLVNGSINPEFKKFKEMLNSGKLDVITYKRNGNDYYINVDEIWDGMKDGKFQVISVTEAEAINQLKKRFGNAVVLLYVHSDAAITPKEFDLFVNNFDKFDHVLIYESKFEDLYDQLFRLFRAYEKGLIK